MTNLESSVEPRTVLYDYAMSLLGTPYRWGGDDPMAGFDCSGLIVELLKLDGTLPSTIDLSSQGLHDHFADRDRTSAASFGSLIFFGRGTDSISHVAMALNSYQMIEAGGGRKLTDDLAAAIKANAYIRVRPINNRSDRVAMLMPSYSWRSKWMKGL